MRQRDFPSPRETRRRRPGCGINEPSGSHQKLVKTYNGRTVVDEVSFIL
jgi:hypothetical protein